MRTQPAHYQTRPRTDLTPRQREVISLMARGHTNGQIAEALGISLDGAKFHVSKILARYGVDSREEAVAAWRAGRSPIARVRSMLPFGFGGRSFAVVSASVATMAAIALVVVLVRSGDGGGDPLPSSNIGDQSETPAASASLAGTIVSPVRSPESPDPGSQATTSDIPGDAIHIVDVATGATRALPADWGPMSWSPDGSKLAVATFRGTWIVDLSTGVATAIGSLPGLAVAWSPDGKRIAVSESETYAVTDALRPKRTVIYRPDGAVLAILEARAATLSWSGDSHYLIGLEDAGSSWIWDGTDMVTMPYQKVRWIKDGLFAAIGVRSQRGGGTENEPAVATTFDLSNGLVVLRHVPLPVPAMYSFLTAAGEAVSRTDTGIVVTRFDSDAVSHGDLPTLSLGFLMDAAGIFPSQGSAFLSVEGLCTGAERVVVVDEGGTEQREVVKAGIFHAAWEPTGDRIAYTSGKELHVIDIEGSDQRLLAEEVMATFPPAWSPDGRWIAYRPFFGGYGRCD